MKPFLAALEQRLKTLTKPELQKYLLDYGRSLPSGKRRDFLEIFSPEKEKDAKGDDRTLLSDIAAFISVLEAGEYFYDWGWDDTLLEERSFGDESWADEMDSLFKRADRAYINGNKEDARQAYERLFAAFSLDEEAGYFCGPDPPQYMLSIDLSESKARYFRTVYENCKPNKRASELFSFMKGLTYYGGSEIGLQGMIEVDPDPLPGFDVFISSWLNFLKKQKSEDSPLGGRDMLRDYLLREAVILSDGVKGLAALGRKEGADHPEIFFDLISILDDKGEIRECIRVAQEGVTCIRDKWKKAELADLLACFAERTDEKSILLKARKEAWRACPTIRRLMLLFADAEKLKKDPFGIVAQEYKAVESGELKVNGCLHAILRILSGDYSEVIKTCKKIKPLGWSSDADNPGNAIFPFLLIMGSSLSAPPDTGILRDWLDIVDELEDDIMEKLSMDTHDTFDMIQKEEDQLKLGRLLFSVQERYPISSEMRKNFLNEAKKAAVKRIRAIVSNKYRRAYERAAYVLAGYTEALCIAGREDDAVKYVENMRAEFPRHTAFQREVDRLVPLQCKKKRKK